MKKKFVILALCTSMLAGTAVQAQKVKLVPDTQKVIFTHITEPNTMGIYFVVKEGGDINDDSQVYALKNAISGVDGRVEFSFIMPEEKNGTLSDGRYDVYIKEEGKDRVKADIQLVYASLGTRNALLEDIKAIPQDDTEVQMIQDILDNQEHQLALEAIGCKLDYIDADTASNMAEEVADFSNFTLENFKDEYNMASVIDDFEDVTDDEADEILAVIDPVFEDVRYSDITDESLTEWLSSYFADNDYDERNYELANILYKFNTFVADKIEDLFEQYDDALGITDDSRYVKYYNLRNKSSVNVKIAEILSRNPAKKTENLLAAVAKSLPSKDNGGSGGGSTGSGGSSFTPPVASTTGGAANAGITGFKDLNQAEWARTAVLSLANAGIVAGDENGSFRPNDYVTREEYVKMLVVAAGKHNIYATCEFKDVPEDAWYYSYVASAKQEGLTSGINAEEFGTGYALTRQDMAVLSLNAKGDVKTVRNDIAFADADEIAGYAKDAVSKLYMSGAVNGTGNGMFNPLGKATRAECALIIYNLFMK